MKTITLIFVLLVCATFTRLSSQTYSVSDSLALVAIDNTCDASDSLNWNTEPDPGNWNGVTWNTETPKRVSELRIKSKSLSGALDVSDLTSLSYLKCENNQLTFLDVSAQVNLTYLHCNINQLTSINVSALTNLTSLECAYNQLLSLDISALTNLYELECAYNQLTSLNVSALADLTYLHCSFNQLTSLDVSDLLNLKALTCASNQLTVLDVSDLVNLTRLHCGNNTLTVLDVPPLTNLTDLGCNMNQLTVLDVSPLTNLTELFCQSNQISSLDVSALTKLTICWCENNKLPFSSLATGLHVGDYTYIPQDTLFESGSVSGNTIIDYTTEALIDGTATQFVFYKDGSEAESNTTGLFTTTGPGEYTCTMTNAKFAGLILTTAPVTITGVTAAIDYNESALNLFPNPVKDIVHIQFSPKQADFILIELYNTNGILVCQPFNSRMEPAGHDIAIDLTLMPKGTYIVRLCAGDEIFYKKLVLL